MVNVDPLHVEEAKRLAQWIRDHADALDIDASQVTTESLLGAATHSGLDGIRIRAENELRARKAVRSD